MSIYATGWEIKFEVRPPFSLCSTLETGPVQSYYATIYVQFVPGHIGHPDEGYDDGDPYSDFLPPVVEDVDENRAAVILLRGFDKKESQRYITPLITMSGQEYKEAKFQELLERIGERVNQLLQSSDILKNHYEKWIYNPKWSSNER